MDLVTNLYLKSNWFHPVTAACGPMISLSDYLKLHWAEVIFESAED